MLATQRNSGFSLVELVMSLTLVGVIAGSIGLVTKSTSKVYKTGNTVTEVDTAARRALDTICDKLRSASSDSSYPNVQAPFATDQIDFQRGIGHLNQTTLWSDPERIVWELSPVETNDGLDNDGNGLVDEGRVVLVENPGTIDEKRTTLCSWVREYLEGETANGLDDNGNGLIDEPGLSLDVTGDSVTVRLSLERPDSDGLTVVRTVEKTVSFRNRGV